MSYAYASLTATLPPSSSASMVRASPLPPSPSSPGTFHYLPPLPISPSSADEQNARTLHNQFHHHRLHRDHHPQNSHSQAPQRKQPPQEQQPQRHMYPTSSPFHRYDISPDPNPPSAIRLPPITSSFTDGYASPAASNHSSDPPSRDELDVVMDDPNSPSGMSSSNNNNNFHGQHVSLPGVDGMLSRGNGMILDGIPSPRHENRDWDSRERWNMRHFTLIQTVGTWPCFTFAAPPSS